MKAAAGKTAPQGPRARAARGKRAVFLDRDGVLNDLEYNREEGNIGSPLSVRQLRVFPYAGDSIRRIREMGFKAIVVSNQPAVAKRQLSFSEFERMNRAVRDELAKQRCSLDGEYYCLHHPNALVLKYRLDCDCRKPKPGLLLRAAKENGLDLASSLFVGDSLADVKAGRAAGVRTVLLGHITTFLAAMIERENAEPDYMFPSLRELPGLVERLVGGTPAPAPPPSSASMDEKKPSKEASARLLAKSRAQ